MKFEKQLVHGTLIRRYKRFLADIKLDNGDEVIAHCTNSGAMTSCLEDDAEVYLTPVDDPKRKTKFTWEMIKINDDWIGVNTSVPNVLAFDAIRDGYISGFEQYTEVRREVKWEDSRFDVMAKNDKETCFIEVKNVTMKEGDWVRFPDAVTVRGRKHLEALIRVKNSGMRAVMFYIVQRSDVTKFGPAYGVDPEYGEALKRAMDEGVEVFVFQAKVTPVEICIVQKLPCFL